MIEPFQIKLTPSQQRRTVDEWMRIFGHFTDVEFANMIGVHRSTINGYRKSGLRKPIQLLLVLLEEKHAQTKT